jgi:hypothetical protein
VYIDNGGSSDEVTWASIGESMAQFASMAADGGFEVNQSGGDALLRAIHKMKDWANTEALNLRDLAQEMPLGTSNAAKVMKPYVQQVAIDEQGFLTQLAKFQQSLANAEQGIRTAMANYQATEDAKAAALSQIQPE